MPAEPKIFERLVDGVERAQYLDRGADALSKAVRRVIPHGPVEDTLAGTPIGHPAHPLLVTVPIGAWTSALVLDAVRADAKASRHLVGLGIVSALPAAAAGATDWLSTGGAERRVGLVHAAANYSGLGLQVASWFARRRGSRGRGTALSAAGALFLGVGGWLGGHLSYALGVGVDTTAFQALPEEWTDAAAEAVVGTGPYVAEVAAVPIVLFRSEGRIVALADRCTHRGGPLHEGTVDGGCIKCPWHGSVFAGDGTVRSGPASRPEPALQVRVVNGRVQVRKDEPRNLRAGSAGR
jgi:nitrite reductase/ring-hydroxylating ferredoxin subunit/uncharacterized membrane protein